MHLDCICVCSRQKLGRGETIVSASFIIPYPPGFPILVPGQVVSQEILAFMRALDVSEIHGYRPDLGLRVFTQEVLEGAAAMPVPVRKPKKKPAQITNS